MQRILIIGLGVIGGSFAKAFAQKGIYEVDAVECDQKTREEAKKQGLIRHGYSDIKEVEGTYAVTIVALNPTQTISLIQSASFFLSQQQSIVCDIAGLQGIMVEALAPVCAKWKIPYMSLHPMAGREKAGFEMAVETLFQGKSCLYTNVSANENQQAVIHKLLETVGFLHVKEVDPCLHDELIAYTSQLPHVVSVAFMNTWKKREIEGYTGGSFEDMTRVSDINAVLWNELFFENKAALVKELHTFKMEIARFESALLANDQSTLLQMMEQSSESKQSVKNQLLKEGL